MQASTVSVPVAKGIDAARLEKELARMWGEMSAPKEGVGGAGVVRACVLNLVVYVPGGEGRAEVDALLSEVTERHPSRAIVIVADASAAEARLEAYVSMRCQLSSRGSKQICGEEITIEAGGAVVETASTAVAPLLVPDVPVFLWWKDIPNDDSRLFRKLSEMADRVVIDSASFDRPREDLLRLAQILEGGRLRLSDLNWGRLTAWRSLVAGFWDVADYRESLASIESIRIEYDPPDRSPGDVASKALLALGWIGSRLGWEVVPGGHSVEGGEARFRMSAGGREVEALLVAAGDVAGRDGMITSLAIKTVAGDEFHVELRLEERRLETSARVGGGHTVGRVLSFEAHGEGQRLSAELDILSRDAIYEAAVAFAARLLAPAAG